MLQEKKAAEERRMLELQSINSDANDARLGFQDFGDTNLNLDFSTLENADVLENFDFDSFLNGTDDDTFNFAAIEAGTEWGRMD